MTEPRTTGDSGKRSREETGRLAARGYARLSTSILYFLGFYILVAPWLAAQLRMHPEATGANELPALYRALGGMILTGAAPSSPRRCSSRAPLGSDSTSVMTRKRGPAHRRPSL